MKLGKQWNRYAVENDLLSIETIMYITNKKYQELRKVEVRKKKK